jgi:hypothetical protein
MSVRARAPSATEVGRYDQYRGLKLARLLLTMISHAGKSVEHWQFLLATACMTELFLTAEEETGLQTAVEVGTTCWQPMPRLLSLRSEGPPLHHVQVNSPGTLLDSHCSSESLPYPGWLHGLR